MSEEVKKAATPTEDDLKTVEDYSGLRIESTQDILKVEVIARLYKNLSLEQLENLEQTVKNTFAAKKKNYILELP